MTKFVFIWAVLTIAWSQAPEVNCSKISPRAPERCNLNCSSVHKPVCGTVDRTNYQLFGNECLLRQQKCLDGELWIQHPVSHCEPIGPGSQRATECPSICPMNYAPICATDGRTNRVFSNQCQLDVENCISKRWMTVRSSVCGDEAMYGVGRVGIKSRADDENDEFACPESCDYTASYVCGFNGEQYRIFGNECTFQLTKCRTRMSWTLKPLAECQSKDEWYFPNS